MKKRIVTYGISGLMECQVVIKIGNRTRMRVMFSDGSMTAYGVTPAKYTTDNFIIQQAIERSSDYKRGRIITISSMELDEEVRVETPTPSPLQGTSPEQGSEEDLETTGGIADMARRVPTATVETATIAETTSIENGELRVEKVSVSDISEAKEYLAEKFGINRGTLRSKNAIIDEAAAHNIEFEGL